VAELKTKPTEQSVSAFLAQVEDAQRRRDCEEIVDLMREITGEEPKMWGPSMVGFGSYHYRYADRSALRTLIERSLERLKQMYG
jgi:hypothetical protein